MEVGSVTLGRGRIEIMDEQFENVNIEEIMSEIRETIRKRGYQDDVPKFDDLHSGNVEWNSDEDEPADLMLLNRKIDSARENRTVHLDHPLSGGGMKLKFKQEVVSVLKGVLYEPMRQQEVFNDSVVRSLTEIYKYMKNGQADVPESGQADCGQASGEVTDEAILKRMQQIEERIQVLEEELQSLRSHLHQPEDDLSRDGDHNGR